MSQDIDDPSSSHFVADINPADGLYAGCSFGDLVVRAIQRFPEKIAIVSDDTEITYKAMGEQISQIIQVFKQMNLKRGDGIAQLSTNRPEAIYVTQAANIMGLRYTPLHPLGSEDDQAFILEDAEISALIVDESLFLERATVLGARLRRRMKIITLEPADHGESLSDLMASFHPSSLKPEARSGDIAWLAYTGGTTGKPKGVILSNRSVVESVLISLADWDWPQIIRFLAVTPVSHSAGLMVVPTFLRGGTLFLHKKFNPKNFAAYVNLHQITATFLVPTMIYTLLDDVACHAGLSSLETIIYGAAPMSPVRLKEALNIFGLVFVQLYGQTEAPNTITTMRKYDHDITRPKRLSSCGLPMSGVQVKLLDIDDKEVSTGQVGEICVRGPIVMDGYWKRPTETEAALRNGWLRTGDLAMQDEDGYLYIVDRSKDLIISGGFNVYPREVEDVLAEHSSISMVAVIGIPDPKWGEAVTAFITLRSGAKLTADEAIALVREKKGAVYAPKSVIFINEIPVTGLGKPDKKALRDQYV